MSAVELCLWNDFDGQSTRWWTPEDTFKKTVGRLIADHASEDVHETLLELMHGFNDQFKVLRWQYIWKRRLAFSAPKLWMYDVIVVWQLPQEHKNDYHRWQKSDAMHWAV